MNLNKNLKLYNKYERLCYNYLSELSAEIQEYADFEIYLEDFPGDRLCVMSEEDSAGMGIGNVISIIKKDGKLSRDSDSWKPYF